MTRQSLQLGLLTSLACLSLLPRGALGAVRLFALGDTGNSAALSPPVQNYTCNFAPYGQDLAPTAGPTGRCCNGKVLVDFIAAGLGFSTVPKGPLQGGPFTTGANAATAGAPAVLGNGNGFSTYSGDVQLQAIKDIIWGTLAPSATAVYAPLPDALLCIELGASDLLNYFLETSFGQWTVQIDPYAAILVDKIVQLVTDAYAFGVRNIVVGNVGPMGCTPNIWSTTKDLTYPLNGCIAANWVVQLVNRKLATALSALAKAGGPIPGARLIRINTYDMYYRAARQIKLSVSNEQCCGTGGSRCGLPGTFKCTDPTKYYFWDFGHPTEIVHSKMWDLWWSGSTSYMKPMNGSTLVQMMNTM